MLVPNTMGEIDLSLAFKKHKLRGNRSFFVLNITSKKDSNFHFQVASIVNNNLAIDWKKLEEELKKSLYFAGTAKKLIFSKKDGFLKFLMTLHFDPITTKLIQVNGNQEHCFKLDKNQTKVEQEYDKNFSKLYIIDTFENDNDTSHLAIQKPEVNNDSFFIFTTDKEKKPISLYSLSDNQECLNTKTIEEDLPYLPIISKEIIRLSQDTRESAKEKYKIFIDIHKMLREKKSQECIIAKLNEVKPVLSEHRNSLSYFFNYFIKKIETRSERALENFRKQFLAQEENHSAEPSFSQQPR